MNNLIYFIYRRIRYFIAREVKRWRFYKKFYVFPPEGCFFEGIENISIDKGFGLSPFCHLFAQGPKDRIVIGRNVLLNFNVTINADAGGVIEVGESVIIGPGSMLRASNHTFEDKSKPIIEQGHKGGKIVIGRNCWIGANCTILPNVLIGEGVTIAAGSVVNKDIESGSTVAGVPAKVIKVSKL